MLRALDIRDMLIIDRLELEFRPGLNVLTGETGAGKSILLDSLGFVLGWRGRAELVRQGQDQGEVVAVFDLPEGHAAHAILEEAGLPGGSELILRRINTSDGRKTAWVNDRRVSGDVLRQISETLIELHGQQDDRGLLNPRTHRDILDAFGGLESKRAAVAKAWSVKRAAAQALDAALAELRALKEEEDFLRHAVEELTQLAPEKGEDAALDAKRRLMQAAERIGEEVQRAASLLGPDGAEGQAGDALRWLEGAAEHADGTLDAPLAAVSRALVELDDAARGISDALETMAFDAHVLEATEERLFALRGLARKHNVTPEALPELAETLAARLAALDAGAGNVAELEQASQAAREAYEAAAQKLRTARTQAAKRLDRAVMAELAPLKMERAVFTTEMSEAEPGPSGSDAVAFRVATNPGAPSGALAKIASGGELSRFLLALKVCLSDAGARTMIFDEIDRGVGGATADAVGRRLQQLADSGQVLVVTHSPQVAALGAHHWRVSKAVVSGATLSRVDPLAREERVDEIARMISGAGVTDAARSAAQSLLAG
ncbi:DNA repair protein RecN [Primorskyibacter sp. S187A]|uniref:DNA repair protein RecN n=1 Tax=Primorskyibacter sp. S187A TaxID=3415130 RepID=UPI003C7C2EFF